MSGARPKSCGMLWRRRLRKSKASREGLHQLLRSGGATREVLMFVVNGLINTRASFDDVAKRLEAGIGPIAKGQPGFQGYYVVQTGDRTGNGVLVYDTAEDWAAAQGAILAWFEENISPLCEGEAQATAGEAIVALDPDV